MDNELTSFARLGLVHHMLYPRCTVDEEYHEATLMKLLQRTDIETLDCCLPYSSERESRLATAIRGCAYERVTFAIHLFPLRKFSLSTLISAERSQVKTLIREMVNQAARMGAYGFIFASGGPPFRELTNKHRNSFYDFTCWLCEILETHGIIAMLEPFDYDFDKCFAYGPLDENLELVDRVGAKFNNIGIELDVAHLPLMREDLDSAIRRSQKWLKRVHLGNCVMNNKTDPYYGDKHPALGYPGGEIGEAELVKILSTLTEIGYLQKESRGDLVLEVNPLPGLSEDETVVENMHRLNDAWAKVNLRESIPDVRR